jgi:hypothetical protein
MGDRFIYMLAGRACGKLAQEASRNDPDLRRAIGHANLLDSLNTELIKIGFTWNDSDAEDEAVAESRPDDSSDPELSADSDTESSTDSDSYSESNSSEDSECEPAEDFSYEESRDDCGAYPIEVMEGKVDDWVGVEFWAMAKTYAGKTPIRVAVQGVSEPDTR